MDRFNIWGMFFMVAIMFPNIVFAIKQKGGFENKWRNRFVETAEQLGRFGCFGFMVINIPGTYFGLWSDEAFAVYLIVDTTQVFLYCLIWILCLRKNSVSRQLCANSKIEICAFDGGKWLRVEATAVSEDNLEAEKHMLAAYPELARMYQPGDGNNEVFRLENVTAMFSPFTEPVRVVKF